MYTLNDRLNSIILNFNTYDDLLKYCNLKEKEYLENNDYFFGVVRLKKSEYSKNYYYFETYQD